MKWGKNTTELRFCRICMNITNWKLDKITNNNYCSFCGGKLGMSDVKHISRLLNQQYNEDKVKLKKELSLKLKRLEQFKKSKNEEGKDATAQNQE